MAKHFMPEHRTAMIKTFEAAKDLKITDLDLVTAEPDLKEGTAPARYRMEYYLLPSVTLKTFEWEQEWKLVEGVWKVNTPFPAIPGGS